MQSGFSLGEAAENGFGPCHDRRGFLELSRFDEKEHQVGCLLFEGDLPLPPRVDRVYVELEPIYLRSCVLDMHPLAVFGVNGFP